MKNIINLVVILLSVTVSSYAQTVQYEIVDLGYLGATPTGFIQSYAYGINEYGQIVGESFNSDGYYHSFSYEHGIMSDLGVGGGASDINNNGQIVGAGLYKNRSWIEPYSAEAINDNGQMTGRSIYNQHAFLYDNGLMIDLGTLGGDESEGKDINELGQTVGWSALSSGLRRAFLYDNGIMIDLNLGYSGYSEAWGINDRGQIVGRKGPQQSQQAFLYDNGIVTYLGTLGGSQSFAYDINNYGQIVGMSHTDSGLMRAFLYDGETMMDLGTLGGNESYAFGLNDYGQIVGWATTRINNERHAIIWKPIGTTFPPPGPIIPEPISSTLFVTGGLLLAGHRYYKRRNAT